MPKSKRRIMRALKINEISAVDRPAQAGAVAVIMKRRGESGYDPKNPDPTKRGRATSDGEVQKSGNALVLLTSSDDGHAHSVWIHPGDRGGSTNFARSPEGEAHDHAWVIDAEGRITIADNEGHVHIVDSDEFVQSLMVMVSSQIVDEIAELIGKSQFTSEQRDKLASDGRALPDGSFPIADADDLRTAISAFSRATNKRQAATHIACRAKDLEATELLPVEGTLANLMKQDASKTADQIGNNPEEGSMPDKDKKAAEVLKAAEDRAKEAEAKLAKANTLGELNDAQREYHKGLDEADQEAFLKLDADGRNAEIKKAADKDKVVYKSDAGEEYRASDDPRLVAMAKRSDEDRKARIAAEKRAEDVDFTKRAETELKYLPGDVPTRVALLKAAEGIEDKDQRAAALKSLAAQNEAMSKAFTTLGSLNGGDADGGEAATKLDALAKKHAEDNKVSFAKAYDTVIQTPDGSRLYAEHMGEAN